MIPRSPPSSASALEAPPLLVTGPLLDHLVQYNKGCNYIMLHEKGDSEQSSLSGCR